jgi:transcription antitermination factor NusG
MVEVTPNTHRPVNTLLQRTPNPWIVLKTRPKCEKFVRDRLMEIGIDAFVPLRRRTAMYNRKLVTYELPLITCYTFARIDNCHRNQALALPNVKGILRNGHSDCKVSDHEIQWLQKISGMDLEIKTEDLSLQTGQQVMLAYGHLAGMKGTILARHSRREFTVALESLGLQMVIKVEPSMVVPVESSC